ncbi:hypothetical protein EVAR_23477_1 [Eumeta japonica]|uniref:Uncharacterized protein n=1 Tax=Eumeta variegata TaxID=151549 RepID=A0A4C1UL70_EUMVA|nr:hypothetical protein EVAR_23477_1 [Eumeta japonica]
MDFDTVVFFFIIRLTLAPPPLPPPVPGAESPTRPACRFRDVSTTIRCAFIARQRSLDTDRVADANQSNTDRFAPRPVAHCRSDRARFLERDPYEPVAAQVFRALRGRLRLLLDGRRRRVREAPALEPRPAEEVRAADAARACAATVRSAGTAGDRPTIACLSRAALAGAGAATVFD